jgi:O-antigen/teichoic acid export membrane protein
MSLGTAAASEELAPMVELGGAAAATREAGYKQGLWSWLVGIALGKNTLALVDQAVVSGTNFLTAVMIGRAAGVGELGIYSLGFSLLVAWTCAQDALIALPYTIYCHRSRRETQAEYAGSVLVHQGLLSALVFVVLLAAGVFLNWRGTLPGLATMTCMLAGVIPFACLREFGRRVAFAHLNVGQALLLDGSAALLQLAGLAWLISVGTLTATTAYAVIGAACALSGAIWLYQARGIFLIRWAQVCPMMRQNWSLGKWLFAWQATAAVQAYFIHWLLAWMLGTSATGVYAACMTMVLFSNPLILGISNALAPKAAHALNNGGVVELRQVIFHTTALVGTVMAMFCLILILFGEGLMDLLYHGQQYAGHGHTVTVLALAMLATALGMPAVNGLMAVERTKTVFTIAIVSLGVSVLSVPILILRWGLVGAAYGFLAGNVVGTVTRWMIFGKQVPFVGAGGQSYLYSTFPEQALVQQVLENFLQEGANSGLAIERIGEGVQGTIHAARRADQQFLWGTHSCLAIKLYKPAAGFGVDQVHEQFTSLTRLHAAVDGSTVEGWTTLAPMPLFVCHSPLALVMTVVPGRELDWYLETGTSFRSDLLISAPRAVVTALRNYWELGHVYGALSFANIHCDPANRELAFLDAGLETDALLCEGVGKRWYPASRDLAYMIYQTGVRVRSGVFNRAARVRQELFTYSVLQSFVESLGTLDEQCELLDEIQACAHVHLRALDVSWSCRGLWRILLRRVAARRIDGFLANFRRDAGLSLSLGGDTSGLQHDEQYSHA